MCPPHASRLHVLLLLAGLPLVAAGPPVTVPMEGPHGANDVYQMLLHDGVTLGGSRLTFPPPLLSDGIKAEDERKALRKLAGSDEAVTELLRDSVTAPQILHLHDQKATDGSMIRIAELAFAVHARLEDIDVDRFASRSEESKPVEAGNMRFLARKLSDEDLKQRKIHRDDPKLDGYSHSLGDLLDRIEVQSTDHMRATQGPGSWVFASVTDRRFDNDPEYPNRWKATGGAAAKASTAAHPYAGGASVTRISRLVSNPEVLFVEGRLVFTEPHAWFEGAPILRSKISLVAQDQVRRLRRELARRRSEPAR